MMHAKWMGHALTQEIITIKLSSSTNSTTVYKVITKKHTEKSQILSSRWQNKNC